MKIGGYAIALNEASHAARWAASAEEADHRFVLDTGSTDGTPDILRAKGVSVASWRPEPWRFDVAKNRALDLLPADLDVIVQLDMDEVLAPGWRARIEAHWAPDATRLVYAYGDRWQTYLSSRITGRQTHRWRGACHERLVSLGEDHAYRCPHLLIEHHREDRDRSSYLPLMEIALAEEPDSCHVMHHAAAEYIRARRFDEAEALYQRMAIFAIDSHWRRFAAERLRQPHLAVITTKTRAHPASQTCR